jgi:hypothetical protein
MNLLRKLFVIVRADSIQTDKLAPVVQVSYFDNTQIKDFGYID